MHGLHGVTAHLFWIHPWDCMAWICDLPNLNKLTIQVSTNESTDDMASGFDHASTHSGSADEEENDNTEGVEGIVNCYGSAME